jgi:hypothetical protein
MVLEKTLEHGEVELYLQTSTFEVLWVLRSVDMIYS